MASEVENSKSGSFSHGLPSISFSESKPNEGSGSSLKPINKTTRTAATAITTGANNNSASHQSLKSRTKTPKVLNVKSHQHPWDSRAALNDFYEGPITDREAWWRCQIRVTPVPGSYETSDFIRELERKPNTYRFKSNGRTMPCDFAGKGALLLPGEYEYHDFIEKLSQKPATYRFKAENRDAFDVLNFGQKDKNINVAPNQYGVEKYLSVDADKTPVRNFMFKSQSKRFPTNSFKPKEGPSPGSYNIRDITVGPPSVTSSFRSKTPRFHTSHTTWI